MDNLNNQETETKELIEEIPKARKRKILTNPEGIRASCKVCKEVGNLERLIRHGIPVKNLAGIVLHGSFKYVYFCSESCKGLFSPND